MRVASYASLLLVLVASARVRAGATTSSTTTTSAPATQPAEPYDFPAFGVTIPPPPDGFEPVTDLDAGMFGSAIAEWRAIDGPRGDNAERIHLMWRALGVGGWDGGTHAFLDAAVNPFGSVRPGPEDFVLSAKPLEVPHPTTFPTLRYERPGGNADAEGIVRTETVGTNNVVYILMHVAPRGATPQGTAAFNAVAASLQFRPPAKLGHTLAPGMRRNPPGRPEVTLQLPDAFRGSTGTFLSRAWDLTGFTHRHGDELETEDFGATVWYELAGHELPDAWTRGPGGPELRRLPTNWLRDDADLRIAEPVGPQSHRRVAVAGGRRIDQGCWFWMLMLLPRRVMDDAGGDAAVARKFEQILTTARAVPGVPPG